jgi:DNA-binding MurR/RpiR family transcriptional regulator
LLTTYDGKGPGSSLIDHLRRSVDQDVENLQRLRNALDRTRLVSLASRIYRSRRVLLFGGDLVISLINFLQYNFMLLGIPVESGVTPGQTLHLARTCSRRDLVIAISFQRGLRQTVEGLRSARANGAYCVGLTDTFISPIARFSDENFLVSIQAVFGTSYAAAMSFLSAMLTACAYYRRDRTLALMRKADEEQRVGFRWYQE